MFRYWCFLLLFGALPIKAQVKPEYIKHIQNICQQSPTECLKAITPTLSSLNQQSRTKFQLILLKMEAMFALEQGEALLEEVTPWINQNNIPQYFKLRCYIYYAKEIYVQDHQLSKQYLHKAIKLLKQSNEVYPNPIQLLDITNLQLFFPDELNDAYDTLKFLEQKYAKRYNPIFKRELYGNLGHVANQLKLYDQQINYRLAALKWSKAVGNQQQISVAQFNLARSYDVSQRFKLAERHYFQAIHFANLSHDNSLLVASRLYLTQLKLNIHQDIQAKLIFNDIEAKQLPKHRQAMYHKLQQTLNSLAK